MAYKAPIWEDGKSPAISAENLNALSQAAEGAQVLYGNSAPTSSTEGAVGQFYLVVVADSDGNYPLYQCVAIANGSCTWRDVLTIPASLAAEVGLVDPATIGDAIARLALSPAGTGTLYVCCKDETGEPVSGCVVQIGEDLAVTGASGAAKYFLAPGTHSVTIRSPIDYGAETQTASVAITLSEAVSIEATIQDSLGGATEVKITSSVTAAFSNRVTSADAFGVGGGGSGAAALRVNSSGNNMCGGATGGGGGYTKTIKNIVLDAVLSIVVGSGGAAVTNSSVSGSVINGKVGGDSKVLVYGTEEEILVASGGKGGACFSGSFTGGAKGANGGSGSGAVEAIPSGTTVSEVGASGVDGASGGSTTLSTGYSGGIGQKTTTRAFGESAGELFSPAGGSVLQYGSKGSRIGECGEGAGAGAGAYTKESGTAAHAIASSATTPGGGGGGAVCMVNGTTSYTYSIKSGAGADGLVILRWEVAA